MSKYIIHTYVYFPPEYLQFLEKLFAFPCQFHPLYLYDNKQGDDYIVKNKYCLF